MEFKTELAFDLDNVIENLTECFLDVYNADSGDNLQIDNITEYRIEKFMKPEYITNEKLGEYFHEACYHLKPLPDSQKYLTMLYDEGYGINIVSTSHFCDMEIKLEFLKNNFQFIGRRNVYVMPNKHKFRCDIMIDDCVDNLKGGMYSRIIYDQPWNRNINDKALKLYRAYNWKDVYDSVHQIEEYKKLYGKNYID